jgi:hypothetical protein
MDEDEGFEPDDGEVSELESEDLTDPEVSAIRRSQSEPDTPDADDPEVG